MGYFLQHFFSKILIAPPGKLVVVRFSEQYRRVFKIGLKKKKKTDCIRIRKWVWQFFYFLMLLPDCDSSDLLEKVSLIPLVYPITLSSLSPTALLGTSSFLLMMTSLLGSQYPYQIPPSCWVTSVFACMSHPTVP